MKKALAVFAFLILATVMMSDDVVSAGQRAYVWFQSDAPPPPPADTPALEGAADCDKPVEVRVYRLKRRPFFLRLFAGDCDYATSCDNVKYVATCAVSGDDDDDDDDDD